MLLKELCAVLSLLAVPCNPMDCSPPISSVHGDYPGKNTGAGCHALLQGIFPTQGLNPGIPHCKLILYCLSHQGSPKDVYMFISVCVSLYVCLYGQVCIAGKLGKRCPWLSLSLKRGIVAPWKVSFRIC